MTYPGRAFLVTRMGLEDPDKQKNDFCFSNYSDVVTYMAYFKPDLGWSTPGA